MRLRLLVCLLVVAIGGDAVPAAAQDRLATGTWSGVVLPPDDQVIEITAEVWYDEEGTLGIELIPPPEMGGSVVAEAITHTVDALSFTIRVPDVISCQLVLLEDAHYEGECIDPDGEAAIMSLFPPAEG